MSAKRSYSGKIKCHVELILTVYIYRVSFDPQHFIKGNCIDSSDEPRIRYKVKFDLYASTLPVEISCHMEEKDDGTFELKWARVNGIADPKGLQICISKVDG